MTETTARVTAVMIDCHDPDALFEFWGALTGVEAAQRYPDYIFTSKLDGNNIRLAFQRVPEEKTVKNRVHLDMTHPDPEALIARIEGLGGSRVQDHQVGDFHWTVMADPEGNEFCIAPQH